MKKLIAFAVLLLLPTTVWAQTQRFNKVVILSTASDALTVAGGATFNRPGATAITVNGGITATNANGEALIFSGTDAAIFERTDSTAALAVFRPINTVGSQVSALWQLYTSANVRREYGRISAEITNNAPSMATGDLVFQPSYQGSFGTERMRLSGAGVLTVGGVTITGASGIATASLFQFSPSRGFMRATADGVFDFEINSGGDFGRITLGGSSSSFPAIKRNGAGIDVRLGDDSGYAPIAASAYSAGATAGASCTITGATAHLTVVNGIVTLCN